MDAPRTEARWNGLMITFGRILLFVFLVYLFLVAVKMFGDSAHLFTEQYQETWNSLVKGLKNPFVGLCLGIFITALMQSSSATTSITVALVATGIIQLEDAVSIVMGANIGTSITCMIVSMGHIRQRVVFARAFSASMIQDNFNLLSVIVCFPLEISFGFFSKSARWIVGLIPTSGAADAASGGGGSWFCNPIPIAVDYPVTCLKSFFFDLFQMNICWGAILMGVLGLALLFYALVNITRNMKSLTENKIEDWLNRVLAKNGYLALLIGTLVTMLVQSSSITTSLMVPLAAAGVLKLRTIYPIVLGANIGTTITALIAAMAYTGTEMAQLGLALALVHTLFNLTGVILFYPIPFMRWPIYTTEFLVPFLMRSRWFVFLWIGLIFFLIPCLGLWLFS